MSDELKDYEEQPDDIRPSFEEWINEYNGDIDSDEGIAALMEAAAGMGYEDGEIDEFLSGAPQPGDSEPLDYAGPNAPIGAEQLGVDEEDDLSEDDKNYLRDQYGAKFPEDEGYETQSIDITDTPLAQEATRIAAFDDRQPEGLKINTGASKNALARLISSFKV
jgi:hypothetical protein